VHAVAGLAELSRSPPGSDAARVAASLSATWLGGRDPSQLSWEERAHVRLAEKQYRAQALRSQLDPSSPGYRVWYRRDWRLFLTTPGFERGMSAKGSPFQEEEPQQLASTSGGSFYSETSSISPAQRLAFRRSQWQRSTDPRPSGGRTIAQVRSEASLLSHRGAAGPGGRKPVQVSLEGTRPIHRSGSGQSPSTPPMEPTLADFEHRSRHNELAPLSRPGSQPSLVPPRRISSRELPPKTPPSDIRLRTKVKKLSGNQVFLEQCVLFH
jgi:hypothetical protein